MNGNHFLIKNLTAILVFTGTIFLSDVPRAADEPLTSGAKMTSALAPVYEPLARHLVDRYDLTNKEGVGIDIGGGSGDLVIALAGLTGRMYWINTDIDRNVLPQAQTRAREKGLDARIGSMYADVHSLPFQSDYADFIVSRGSFQFWKDWNRAFSEIYRVLKPGGVAYIGRGFSENLPVDVARKVRSSQKESGGMPAYDPDEYEVRLGSLMKALGIRDYHIIRPRPTGADDISYGVWVELRKPGTKDSEYTMPLVEVVAEKPRDVMAEPLAESAGLELSTTTVGRADIERRGAKTVVDALNYVPGAWIETRGRNVKQFFSVRGQKYPYPEYAIDGALMREFHETPYFFSTASVERIEVMRSSAALLSGISGLTGIVNIVPRKYDRPETSWNVEYGSFETYRARISHGATVNGVSYAVNIDTPHTDGPKGRNAAENMGTFHGMASFSPRKDLSVRANLFHINGKRELTLALPPAQKTLLTRKEKFDPFRTTMGTLTLTYTPSPRATTDAHFFYAERDNLYSSDTAGTVTTAREWDYEWGANIVQAVRLTENNVIRTGLSYNRWRAPYGKRYYKGRKCDLETGSLAVVDEHTFGRLTLDGGVRIARTYIHDYGAFDIEGDGKAFTKVRPITDEWEPFDVSGSAGASYHLSPVFSFFTNGAAGVVKPRRGALTASGAEPDDEFRVKVDVGARATLDRYGEASVTVFAVDQTNAIALTGETRTTSDGIVMELYDNRDRRQTGVELSVTTASWRNAVRGFANITAMNPEYDVNGSMKKDPEVPGTIAGGGIMALWRGLDANLYWKYISPYKSARFSSLPDPVGIGDFTTLDLTAGWTFRTVPSARVYIELTNLTDKEYSTVVGYPDFGRRWILGIRQTF